MRKDARVAAWFSAIAPDDRVVICTITRGEILFGLEKLAPGRRRSELEEKATKLFAAIPCEPIPRAALVTGTRL
jgi:predicted nucleic acid-binding protein